MKRKILCALVCLCILLSMVPPVSAAGSSITAGGWNETIWAKISGVTDSQITAVRYTGTTSGSLTGDDLRYLVREENGVVRIDIPGVSAGTYTLTVTTDSGILKAQDIVVDALDRSGYAHFNYTAGVGAYNDDGTLKKNAIVLYVTEANKNTVSVTSKDGTTVTGIGNILNSVGQDVGGGLNSKGGKANTNGNILRKLAADGTPLVVRIIGKVTAPDGLTAYNSVDYGGSKGDNGYMARMSGGKDITIEGIGTGATMDGWGLHFICQTADYAAGYGKSFEVRNLTFKNVPEDCVGMEGQQEDSTLTAPVERCWIHHCAFYGPTISNPAESDKDGGDGACDFKRGQYFTNSYCYYEGYHKTNLVGSSDSSLQYNMTYHHNYWKNCESRGPLARQANIHMYNNIFEGQSAYCMSLRANAYIFSEYNMYINCKQVTDGKAGGVCKSYRNSFTSCSGTGNSDLVIVGEKSTTVSSNNKYANFDTKSNLSYIPSGKYILQESIPEMKAVVMANAGPQKATIVDASEVNTSVIPSGRYPTAAVVLDYAKNLNKTYITAKSGTFDNIVFNVSKTDAGFISVGGSTSGCDIVFYVDTAVNITLTEHSSTSSHAILCNAVGESILIGSGTAQNLPSGYYFIQSNNYDVGSGKYKEAKLAALTIQAVDPNAATNPIPTPPDGGGNNGGNDGDGGNQGGNGGENGGEVTIPAGSYVHNFTESGLDSDFYTISGNLSTSKGSVTFDGLTLTRCLKIESKTSITFTAPESGKLILVFGGNTSAAGKTIKIDGVKQTIGADHILSVTVSAGSHSITKGDSINLFYMAYASDPVEVHTHSYQEEVTQAATCTEAGLKTYTCQCGDSYTQQIAPSGHSFGDWQQVPGGGEKYRCCETCGYEEYETQPPCTHDQTDIFGAKEATCTEDGHTGTVVCRACAVALEEGQVIPALGHSFGQWVTAPGGETKQRQCETCGYEETEDLPPCDHENVQWDDGVEATCTTDGRQSNGLCQDCGCCVEVGETIPATGHSFDQGVTEGERIVFTCQVCGHTEYQDAPNKEDPTHPTNPVEPTPTQPENPDKPGDSQNPDQTHKDQVWLIAVPIVLVLAAVTVVVLRKKKK